MKSLRFDQYESKYHDMVQTQPGIALHESETEDFRLPCRNPVSHKYSYGRALIVAGALGYAGAPVLAANACERSGAGLTQLMVPESIYVSSAARCDGAVVTPLPTDEKGGLSDSALPQIEAALVKAKAAVIGPGLGTGNGAKKIVSTVIRHAICPVVLDADGLNACADDPGLPDACPAPLILTPHEGEFKRLGGDLTRGRLSGALRFTAEHPHVILILKGYGTLICRGGEAVVNPTGGPAMAKGGSGDVLAGILGALLAQGFDAWFSARCAVYLHGLAGDFAAAELGEYCLAPSDLVRCLPKAFRTLENAIL